MGTIPASENVFPIVRLSEVAAPSTPPTGEVHLYAKADGLLYWKDDAGTEYAVDVSAHLADTSDAHDASAVSVADAGNNFTGTDVEAVLAELAAASGGGNLDDLGDVTITSPATDDVLVYNGSAWVNDTAPGGSAADDTEPSGGTIYRGSAGSTSGWTTGQSPTTFDADSSLPDMFYLAKTALGSGNIVTARRSVGGSFPRVYTMRVGAGRLYQDFSTFGLIVGEASPGKYLSWGPVRDGGNMYLQRQLWTNETTAAGSANLPTTTDVLKDPRVWLRLDVNSSTDIDLLFSYDGYIWHEYVTAYNPSFTVGTFGFYIAAYAVVPAAVGVRWIHES